MLDIAHLSYDRLTNIRSVPYTGWGREMGMDATDFETSLGVPLDSAGGISLQPIGDLRLRAAQWVVMSGAPAQSPTQSAIQRTVRRSMHDDDEDISAGPRDDAVESAVEGTEPPFRGTRVAKRSLRLPVSERERLRRLAFYLRRIHYDSGLTRKVIAARARLFVPTISDSTISRLTSPDHMVAQSGSSWIMVDAVLQALGASHAEMERALASNGDAIRADEQERALVHLYRAMPPVMQRYLLEDAQRYLRRALIPATSTEELNAIVAQQSLTDIERTIDIEDEIEERGGRRGPLSRRPSGK